MSRLTDKLGWVLAAAVSALALAAMARIAHGGPLDPPGPPGSTDGVREVGTPISSIPYTINSSGYYYLTRNLSATSNAQNGISIAVGGVTLDLRGFALSGYQKTGTGIGAANGVLGIVVENGILDSWGAAMVMDGAKMVHISGVTAMYNGLGMSVFDASVEDCDVSYNDGGIAANASTIRRCEIRLNNGNGITLQDYSLVEDIHLRANGSQGYYGIAITGKGSVVRDNIDASAVPFVGLFPGANSNLIIRNRYNCSPGIIDNSGQFNYIPSNNTLENTNGCF
jgi:hypothetical protein